MNTVRPVSGRSSRHPISGCVNEQMGEVILPPPDATTLCRTDKNLAFNISERDVEAGIHWLQYRERCVFLREETAKAGRHFAAEIRWTDQYVDLGGSWLPKTVVLRFTPGGASCG